MCKCGRPSFLHGLICRFKPPVPYQRRCNASTDRLQPCFRPIVKLMSNKKQGDKECPILVLSETCGPILGPSSGLCVCVGHVLDLCAGVSRTRLRKLTWQRGVSTPWALPQVRQGPNQVTTGDTNARSWCMQGSDVVAAGLAQWERSQYPM